MKISYNWLKQFLHVNWEINKTSELLTDLGLEVEGESAKLIREIDGGKEMISSSLPMVIGGQKGLVQESELRIPNMRGIMQSRTKPLQVLEPSSNTKNTSSVNFENPEAKGSCRMVDASNVSELVDLLHNEAKII